MKRIATPIIAMILLVILAVSLSSCSGIIQEEPVEQKDSLSIYATFYPIYALTEMVANDILDVELHCLVQPQDGCLRNYQLSNWDLSLLTKSADAVIAGGRGLESFESVLYSLGEKGPSVSAILYNMELKNVAAVNSDEDRDSHWIGDNPHIYMQIDGAVEMLNRIAAHLKLIDPANSEAYSKNAANAQNRLESLIVKAKNIAETASGVKAAVLNEALVYCAYEYGLEIALAYERESGENLEGADLENCIDLLKSSGVKIILIEKQAPQSLCSALENAGFTLARMDTLSTRRANEGSGGFFEAYEENAHALSDALTASNTAFQADLSGVE